MTHGTGTHGAQPITEVGTTHGTVCTTHGSTVLTAHTGAAYMTLGTTDITDTLDSTAVSGVRIMQDGTEAGTLTGTDITMAGIRDMDTRYTTQTYGEDLDMRPVPTRCSAGIQALEAVSVLHQVHVATSAQASQEQVQEQQALQ